MQQLICNAAKFLRVDGKVIGDFPTSLNRTSFARLKMNVIITEPVKCNHKRFLRLSSATRTLLD